MANPSLQIGNNNWAIKEDNLLGYSTAGTRFVPLPITMTRATLGTRVNPSGLVENVQIVSDTELITNGDFATDSDWSKGTGWTISGGTANCDGSQTGTSNLNNSVSNGLVNNVSYVVKYTISNYSAGSIRIKLGNTGYGDYNSANGTYTATLTALVSTFPYAQFNADSSFVGSIDNVSVKEYTSADMDVTRATAGTRVDENGLVNYAEVVGEEEVTDGDFSSGSDWYEGTGCTISGNQGIYTTAPSGSGFTGNNSNAGICTVGKRYTVVFTIDSISLGALKIRKPFNSSTTYTETGTYTETFIATDVDIYIQNSGTTTASISNISVKEVTRDNVPRIDYTGGGCPHILAEPQRTNLLTYSEDFSNAIYIKDSTVSVGTTNNVSPSGESNATKIDVTASGRIYSNVTTDTYVSSIFIKAGTFAYFKLAGVQVDLVAETNANGTIESLDNGWFKVGVNYTGNRPFQIQAYPDGSYVTHTTSGNYFIWGSQIEAGTYATSYIPTSGSTVTRNQDIFTRDGVGSLINSTEGVLFAEMASLFNDGTFKGISLSDGSTSNVVRFYTTPTANQFSIRVTVGGVHQFNVVYTLSDLTAYNKVALKYKANDFAFWVNGVEVKTYLGGTTFASNTLNKLALSNGSNSDIFFGKVKQLQVYNTALTDAQLTSLTT